MSRIFMAAALAALSLSACAAMPAVSPSIGSAAAIADATGQPPPGTIADMTTADETAGIAFESAVTTAAELATLAVRTGAVPAGRLVELRERVAWARVAVGSVRAAYDVGNATSYKAAVAGATCAIARVRTLATGQADQPCPAIRGAVR